MQLEPGSLVTQQVPGTFLSLPNVQPCPTFRSISTQGLGLSQQAHSPTELSPALISEIGFVINLTPSKVGQLASTNQGLPVSISLALELQMHTTMPSLDVGSGIIYKQGVTRERWR